MTLRLAKLTPPETRQALPRKRLFARLGEMRCTPVIWVDAPAGSGKTTLIASYIAAEKRRCLWYQMDGGDHDMASFFHYMGKALRLAAPGRHKLPKLTPAYRQGLPEFTRHFFRELFHHLGETALLVLDNFQETGDDSETCAMLALACEEIPPGSNIIISSRSGPPAPFARLRATRRLDRISWPALQLTQEETRALIRQCYPHLDITDDELLKLEAHCQGWVTGLMLLLEQGNVSGALDNARDETDRQYLFDYFAHEIFGRIDPETHRFLITTAIFPHMDATICRRLTGNPAAGKILAGLARRQSFTVRRGTLKPRYEYHPLFRHFLNHQAQAVFDAATYRNLQQRAGQLLAEAGDTDEAATLLIEAEAWSALSALILKHASEQIRNGRNHQLGQWLECLPAEQLAQQPWLRYWQAMSHLHYDNQRARRLFERAYRQFKEEKNARGLYLSWCGVSDAFRFAHDHFSGADQWIDELKCLQAAHAQPLSLELRVRLTLAVTGLMLWCQPDNPELAGWIARLEAFYRRIPNDMLRVMSAGQLCIYYSQMGDIAKLRKLGTRIEKLSRSRQHPPMVSSIIMVLRCSVDWLTGDLTMDRTALDRQQQFIREQGLNIYSAFSLAQSLYHANCRGDQRHMEELLDCFAHDIDDDNTLDQCYYQLHACNLEVHRGNDERALNHARLAWELAQQSAIPFPQWLCHSLLAYLYTETKQYSSAKRHLRAARNIAESLRSPAGMMMVNMIRCYLAQDRWDTDTARPFLETAFRLARENGIRSSAVWPPRMISTLCSMALEYDIETDYARDLIQRYHYQPCPSLTMDERWPWPLKIYSLGRFSVLLNGQAIDAETRPFTLIKALLACGGRDVPEERIMDMLWPEADGNQALSNFKTTLHRLRKSLGDGNVLILRNHKLSLNEQRVWVDSWAISRIFTQAQAVSDDHGAACARLASRLTHLYRGHFLANETASWALQKRQALQHRFFRHLIELARHVEDEDPQTAHRCYHHLLELDTGEEEAWQGVIRCYRALGREAEARVWHEKYLAACPGTESAPRG